MGPSPSPLPDYDHDNPFGACFAAITATALIFRQVFPDQIEARLANVLKWTAEPDMGTPFPRADAGKIWFVGAGSVGSAAAFFLAVAGIRFEPTLFDMDIVKIENLNRSPIFSFEDLNAPKVQAVKQFLEATGYKPRAIPESLKQSGALQFREVGVPDIMISAANEEDVRYEIEQGYPPIQIFGTTGQNWQSTVLRFIPPQDACSCCVFPPDQSMPTACATERSQADAGAKKPDAALPFFSFAAGLMTAAEIAKLSMPGFPYSDNRAFFQPLSEDFVFSVPINPRADCFCHDRRMNIFRKILKPTRFGALSNLD